MKLKPDAILFDLDGVLVDSFDAWLASLNDSFTILKRKEISREEFLEIYWGYDLYSNIKRMNLPENVGELCNKKYEEHIEKVKIIPNAKQVLEKLKDYKKAIITNTPRSSAIKVLKKFYIYKEFDFVLTSDDVRIAKPDPEIVLKSCRKLKIDPRKALLIGDTESDVNAGKAAGCKVIGINIDADYKVENISEIVKLIYTNNIK